MGVQSLKRTVAMALDVKTPTPTKKLPDGKISLQDADDGFEDGKASSSSASSSSSSRLSESLPPVWGGKQILDAITTGLDGPTLFALYGARVKSSGGGVLVGGKHKHFYTFGGYATTYTIPSAAATTAFCVNLIPETDNEVGRITRQVRLRSIDFRFLIGWLTVPNGSQSDAHAFACVPVRLIVFWDKMPIGNGTNTTKTAGLWPVWAEDVYDAVGENAVVNTLGAGINANCNAVWNFNTMGTRYEIIHDEVFCPQQNPYSNNIAGVPGVYREMRHHINIPLGDRICTYADDSNDGQLTQLMDHQLFYHIIADGNLTSQSATFQLTTDLIFTDVLAG